MNQINMHNTDLDILKRSRTVTSMLRMIQDFWSNLEWVHLVAIKYTLLPYVNALWLYSQLLSEFGE